MSEFSQDLNVNTYIKYLHDIVLFLLLNEYGENRPRLACRF
jgi:hypothetical protein